MAVHYPRIPGFKNNYVRYVSHDGNDGNDGTTWGNAKRTIAAAVSSLPILDLNGANTKFNAGTVFIAPSGYANPYNETAQIIMNRNLHLVGVGGGGVTLPFYLGATSPAESMCVVRLADNANHDLIVSAGIGGDSSFGDWGHDIQITNLCFDLNGANNTQGGIVLPRTGYDAGMDDVVITNAKADALTLNGATVNFSMKRCGVRASGGNHIVVNWLSGSNNCMFQATDLQFDEPGQDGTSNGVPILVKDQSSAKNKYFGLTGVKSENDHTQGSASGAMYVVKFDITNSTNPLYAVMHGLVGWRSTGSGSTTGTAIVGITASSSAVSDPHIMGAGWHGDNYGALIEDAQNLSGGNPRLIGDAANESPFISYRGNSSARPLFYFGNGVGEYTGAGAPTLTANKGSLYHREDGGVGTCLYINEDGATTWTPVAHGGDVSSNTSTSVVGELAQFSDTAGKTLKRSTGTGLILLTSGVASIATAGTDYEAANKARETIALASGRYYRAPEGQGAATNATLGNGSMRLCPFWVPTACTISGIGAECTTVGDSTSVLRLGIYDDDGTYRPGTLILNAGTISGNSATVQEITISQALTRGWKWIASVVQGVTTTQPTIRTFSNPLIQTDLGTTIPSAAQLSFGWLVNSVTGALPSTPTLASPSSTAVMTFIKVA